MTKASSGQRALQSFPDPRQNQDNNLTHNIISKCRDRNEHDNILLQYHNVYFRMIIRGQT